MHTLTNSASAVIALSVLVILATNPVHSETIYQKDPATGRVQYEKPALKREGDKVYEVKDGRTQYGKPGYIKDGNQWCATYAGTNRIDYHKPCYSAE